MIEGQLVQIVGKMPKGLESAPRVGTLLWSYNKQVQVLLATGEIFMGSAYEIIEVQKDAETGLTD